MGSAQGERYCVRRVVLALIPLCATSLLVGCGVPGSSLTRVAIEGRVVREDGSPLGKEKLEVLLPASYGLTGLDRWQSPESFGHRTQKAEVITDGGGHFRHLFEPVTYSIVVLLLPPVLLPLPLRPPKPTLGFRIPGRCDDYCVVGFRRGQSAWKVYPLVHGQPLGTRGFLKIKSVSVEYALGELGPPKEAPIRGWAAKASFVLAE